MFPQPHSRFIDNSPVFCRRFNCELQNKGPETDSYFGRFWGDDELDRLSVTSRKMVTYTRVDCVGASKVSVLL